MGAENTVSLSELREAVKTDLTALLADFGKSQPGAPAQPSAAMSQGTPATTEEANKVVAKQASMAGGAAGIIQSGDSFRLLNVTLPIASAVVGTSLGIIGGDVVDAIVPPKNAQGKVNIINPAVQGLVAVAALKYGPRYMGQTASYFTFGSIAVRLALRYTPLAEWIGKVDDAISKPLSGVAGKVTGGQTVAYNAVSEAQSIVSASRNGHRDLNSLAFS